MMTLSGGSVSAAAAATTAAASSLAGLSIIDSPYELLGQCIATGNFGAIYLARNNETHDIVAAKLVAEDKDPRDRLKAEYELHCRLAGVPGVPKTYWHGRCDQFKVLVMELLGLNLEQYFVSCHRKLSVRATTQIGLKIVDIVQYIHRQGLLLANIKPENFCFGPPNTARADNIYMIALSKAVAFEGEGRKHIPKKIDDHESGHGGGGGGVCSGGGGTPRYMSLNAHKGKRLSRRDDLESIGYMLIYFILGRLPWQGIAGGDQCERYERIYAIKKSIRLEELCHSASSEYYHYMLYVRTLKYDHEPNYRYISRMWTQLVDRLSAEGTATATATITATTNNGGGGGDEGYRKQVSFSGEKN